MRLLLACLVLFLAPASALVITEGYVSGIEEEFLQDAQSQVNRLKGIVDFYPPNVKKMRDAPAIRQLELMTSNASLVSANVCATTGSAYQRLFDRLTDRCGRWTVLRRARTAAVISVILTAGAFAVVLLSRIRVTRSAASQEWSGDWIHWFVLRGMPLLILLQVAVSAVSYYIVLQTVTGKAIYAVGILALPFAGLFLLERRLVLAFVDARSLTAARPKRSGQPPRERSAPRYIVR